MKIITIGDIHGRDFWNNVLQEQMDTLVFIGDYFDSYNQAISAPKEIENFEKILNLKRDNPNMVKLLIGNHDFHYLYGIEDRYSRYQRSFAREISSVLESALDAMQMCYVYK
ncbi:metallophosphoesterase, partial [Pedobacter sp.]|uniref:metallophosphoesterase n=1 Tax=Pedobacter sp. TaxID=1411316 RepID=UPI003D7F33FE